MKQGQPKGFRRRRETNEPSATPTAAVVRGVGRRFGYGLLIVLNFLCGLAIGLASSKTLPLSIERLTKDPGCAQAFPFINPARRCKDIPLLPEFEGLEDELEAWAEQRRASIPTEYLSVYFRDLQNGPWFGIHEDEFFTPASLFKVPLMMAVLKTAAAKPDLLEAWVETDAELPVPKNDLDDTQRVVPGRRYTVEELLRLMIVHSDNAAAVLLERYVNAHAGARHPYDAVFDEMGIRVAQADDKISALTVKSYASFFRYLYNASYLGKEMSDRALALLAHSEFRDGIVAGVPSDIRVSHKFGIVNIQGQDTKQFHDCGIVYHPRRPYLLCIMTRSTDISRAAEAIRYVSRRIYEDVEQRIRG